MAAGLTQREIKSLFKKEAVQLAEGCAYGVIESVEYRGRSDVEYEVVLHVRLENEARDLRTYHYLSFHQQTARTWGNLTQAVNAMRKLLPDFHHHWINPYGLKVPAPNW